jgi:hypothetical protein
MRRGGIETAIGHWSQLMEGLQASPKNFYASIEEAIKLRGIPGCRLRRVDWPEGGWFSARREYLRAKRGRYLVDICGAPFGNAFFASSWLCFPPPSIWIAIAVVIASGAYGVSTLSILLHVQFVPGEPIFTPWIIGILVRGGLALLVAFLVTVFGIIRPLFFPPRLTFYRYDTAQMFYRAVQNAVGEVVQNLRSEQGLRLLTDDELKPIMRGFER